MDPAECLLLSLKLCSLLRPSLVKLYGLCLSTSTFPSSWKYAYIEPVPWKGGRSNPSCYSPIAFHSCLSKAFETILKRKILSHISAPNLLSDSQHGFHKRPSTGNVPAFLTLSWSTYHSWYSETFVVALGMLKAFGRVWHKYLHSKLHYFGLYPFLCTFIYSFLSSRFISATAIGHCSTPKPINSDVPEGSALSPTLLLPFINHFR